MESPPTLNFACHHKPYSAIDPCHEDQSMKGKTVLITGGGRGIGLAIAESFALANASNIVVVGRTQSRLDAISNKLSTSHGISVFSYVLDIASENDIRKVMDHIRTDVGSLHVLVLNASHLHEPSKITDDYFAIDDFWNCFEVNIKGNLNLTRAFIQQAAEDATIINMTSFLEYLPPFPYPVSGYASSKAAFTKVLNYIHDESPKLRIFNVHPGTVVTEMMIKCGVPPESDEILYTDPMLPGNFCVWLATSKAGFLSGRTVEAAWDVTDMERSKEVILADPRVLSIGLISRGHVPMCKTELL